MVRIGRRLTGTAASGHDPIGGTHADTGTVRVRTSDERRQALALLEQLGPEARLIAGGHSLLPMMKLRLARPERLIDINDLAGSSRMSASRATTFASGR